MIALRNPSQAATSDVYEDLKPMIRRIARTFARRYDQDEEECFAEANLHFMEAYLTFDPERSRDLRKRVRPIIWNRLLSRVRLDEQRLARLQNRPFHYAGQEETVAHRPSTHYVHFKPQQKSPALRHEVHSQTGLSRIKLSEVAAHPEPNNIELRDTLESLADDARTVVRLVFEGTFGETAGIIKRNLVRHLRFALGWNDERVELAFANVSSAL
jgi:RNA polymerase sigma factor (sigma-70 family)